jgi:hypothetical protein
MNHVQYGQRRRTGAKPSPPKSIIKTTAKKGKKVILWKNFPHAKLRPTLNYFSFLNHTHHVQNKHRQHTSATLVPSRHLPKSIIFDLQD